MATTDERINKAREILDQTLTRVEKEAGTYEARAARERKLHQCFSAGLAILAVAAPALVTYQSQVHNPTISMIAILVTAVAGAGTTLQSTFRWGDRFRRTRLTALELSELVSITRLRKQDMPDQPDVVKSFQQFYELNQAVAKRLQAIVRRHIEAEVSLVSPPTSLPEGGGASDSSGHASGGAPLNSEGSSRKGE